MTDSMGAAMESGDMFTFTAGAAVVGLVIHMLTGAMYGVIFAFLARGIRGVALIAAGAVYGVAVLPFSGYIALPVAAEITGSGDPIADMADMVGWGTFAVEHVIFGTVLGAGLLALRGEHAWRTAEPGAHATA